MNELKEIKILQIPLHITENNGVPALKLIKVTSDPDLISSLIYCAIHEKPIVIYPTVKNKMFALCHLLNRGLAHRTENGEIVLNF